MNVFFLKLHINERKKADYNPNEFSKFTKERLGIEIEKNENSKVYMFFV